MTKTLDYIINKYGLKDIPFDSTKPCIEIPNVDRMSLTNLFAELGFQTGVEVGVEQGLYSKALLEANRQLKLFCVDPWLAYQGYREHVSQDKLDAFLEITKQRLVNYNFEIVRKLSVDAAKDFEDNSLDFVYIDGNHEFSHVVADICAWYPKVRRGGILSGHDYISRRNPSMGMHVPEAVIGFTSAYKVFPYFVLGRKDKRPGEVRDNSRSWMLVKEQ